MPNFSTIRSGALPFFLLTCMEEDEPGPDLVFSDSDNSLHWDHSYTRLIMARNQDDEPSSLPNASAGQGEGTGEATGGGGTESNAAQNSTRVSVERTELNDVVTQSTKNNYSRLVGLKHFGGGCDKDPEKSNKAFETKASQGLRDLETLTYIDRKAVMTNARRRPGETIPLFWARIKTLAIRLWLEKPDHRSALEYDLVGVLLTALPRYFQYDLTEADMGNPEAVYKKAFRFINTHTQLKLTDSDVRKEAKAGRQTVAVVTQNRDKPASYRSHRREEPKAEGGYTNPNSITCFRCQKRGHLARNCRVTLCNVCSLPGHTAATCRRATGNRAGNRPAGGWYKQKTTTSAARRIKRCRREDLHTG